MALQIDAPGKFAPEQAIAFAAPDGSATLVSAANPLPIGSGAGIATTPTKKTTSATNSVTAAAADTAILAANTNRLPGSTIANDSTSIMYVLLGSGAASATNYTVAIDGKTTVAGYYILPDGWTGAVRAYWVSATGSARVTELSA